MRFIISSNVERRICLVIVGIFCILYLTQAQDILWSRTYTGDRPLMYFSSIQKYDSLYTIIGGTRDINGLNFTRILIADLDRDGNFVSHSTIGDSLSKSFGAFYNTLYCDTNKYLLYTGYSVDTSANLVLLKKNLQSDSIVTYEYHTPSSYAFQGYGIQKVGQDYYVSGVHNFQPGFNSNIVLLKIDSTGNLLWQKYYDQNAMDYARSIVTLSNGNLMLGAVRNDLNQTNERSNTWLLEVDTGGNIVRQWFDPNDSTYVAEGLKQTQDGGFIYGAQKKREQTVNDVYKTSTIVKLDSNFNKQWFFDSDTLSPTGFTDIEILPDGSYIACGSKNYHYAWIVKLSATGQKLWSKEYVGIQTWGSQNFLTDIDVLPDGGLIAVGQCQLSGATPPQVGWFLKLDSNGCEVENCMLGIDEAQMSDEGGGIQVWPNPASGVVQIALDAGLQGGEVQITDVQGKVVKTLKAGDPSVRVDISNVGRGLYMLTIQHQGRVSRAKLVVE